MAFDVFQNLRALRKSIAQANSADSAWKALERFCCIYGIAYARLSVFQPNARIEINNVLYLKVFEANDLGWSDHYIKERMFDFDQSVHLVRRPGVRFQIWSKMAKATRKRSLANRVFTEAKQFGLGEGVLVKHENIPTDTIAFLGIAGPAEFIKNFRRARLDQLIDALEYLAETVVESAFDEGEFVIPAPDENLKLHEAEREILERLCTGLTQAEVAAERGSSLKTVENILGRMMDRLGQATTVAAIAHGFRNNLLSFQRPELSAPAELTRAEYEIMVMLSLGRSQKDIGEIRGVSPATIHKTIQRMKKRLGLQTTDQAMAVAFAFELIN